MGGVVRGLPFLQPEQILYGNENNNGALKQDPGFTYDNDGFAPDLNGMYISRSFGDPSDGVIFIGHQANGTARAAIEFRSAGLPIISLWQIKISTNDPGKLILRSDVGSNSLVFTTAGNVQIGALSDLTPDTGEGLQLVTTSLRFEGMATTGAAAPVLTANKPGATTAIFSWAQINVDGTPCVFPVWEEA